MLKQVFFKVNEDGDKINFNQAVEFHLIEAKILFAAKWGIIDTCTSISFRTLRVREPEKVNWEKLFHIMEYTRGTSSLPMILSANDIEILKYWID